MTADFVKSKISLPDSGLAEHFAGRIAGSEDIYDRYWRGDFAHKQ